MESIKISVIIPVYKVEPYLRQCLDSVVDQTYKNLEIICVDDGSPDKCGTICDEYAKKDSRIRVIHRENGGLSAARNSGIDIATGEYICFIDSDDFVSKSFVKYLYTLIKKYKADISVCPLIRYISDNKIDKGKGFVEDCVDSSGALSRIFSENRYIGVVACNKMYSRKLFDSIRYPEGKFYEDSGTTYKLFLESKKIAFGEYAKYYYRVARKGQITTSGYEKKLDKVKFLYDMKKCFMSQCPEVLYSFETFMFSGLLGIYADVMEANVIDKAHLNEIKTFLISVINEEKNMIIKNKIHISKSIWKLYYRLKYYPRIYLTLRKIKRNLKLALGMSCF